MSFLNTTAKLRHASPLPAGTNQATAVRLLLQDHAFYVQCGPHSIDCVRVPADEEAKLEADALAADASGERPLPAAVRTVLEAKAAGTAGGSADAATTAEPGSDGGAVTDAPVARTYRVTDVVHTLPAGLWDSRVVSTYEMTDMPGAGVFVRIRSPMSVTMDTTWRVVPAGTGAARDAAEAAGTDAAAAEAEVAAAAAQAAGTADLELLEEIVIYCSRLLVGTVKGLCDGGWAHIHGKMIARLTADKE